ncbi:MAG TPA: hypothetical protein VF981_14155 [Gemmatimonadaceae bacterium]
MTDPIVEAVIERAQELADDCDTTKYGPNAATYTEAEFYGQLVAVARPLIAAKAWDEGFDAGELDVMEHDRDGWDKETRCTRNPYRIEGK